MKRKPNAVVLVILFAIAVCCIGGWFYFGIYGHRGTATNIQALAQVYQADNPNLGAFYTNAFLHKLRFTAPIRWHRAIWRPSVAIASQVDVVAFRRDMSAEPFVYLHAWDDQA